MAPAPQASRWLFSPSTDVAVFFGVSVASLVLSASLRALGVVGDAPPWLWLVTVVFVDVAHVWSTVFRVYGDGAELSRRPLLYGAAPLVAYGLGVAAHELGAAVFWRCMAYVAAWHFVRQQVGWMVLYARRARKAEWLVRLDRALIYALTVGPLVWWHAHLPRPFWWFKEGDFVPGLPPWVGSAALAGAGAVLLVWGVVQAMRLREHGLHAGQWLFVVATLLAWSGGIVLAPDDVGFTVSNVLAHGIPYLALTYRYATGRRAEEAPYAAGWLLKAGVVGFVGVLALVGFAEEFCWDALVWHEHPQFFGQGGLELSDGLLSLVVPLLSLPQTTHYVLDGFVWRTRGDPALPTRLGWS